MDPLFCENLSKSFGGVQVLSGISLQFPQSGAVAIIGPNGAGKTTLLNVLTGFLRADGGRCLLGSHDITTLRPYQIARLGVARTFQNVRMISQISVLDNVLLSCPNQLGESLLAAVLRLGVDREERRNRQEGMRLLQLVGLEECANDSAGDISYGQQKLLALACCLATKARILMLDEPVAGLQPLTAVSILNILRSLGEQGKLVIFIEHDITAVRQIADIVVAMERGRVIAQGAPAEVLDSPEVMEAYLA